MNSDKNMLAVFEPIPPIDFSTVGGRYVGLLIDEGATNYTTSGFITLRVSRTGSYSGIATIGGIPSTLRGQFDRLGYAPLGLRRGSLLGSLQIDRERSLMTGFITDGSKSPTLTLYRTAASTNAGSRSGSYTLTFPLMPPPPNAGAGSTRILTSARARLRGVLGDGRAWSDQTFLTPDGRIPVFTRLYHNRGALLGWLDVAGDGTVSGDLRWFRPADSRSTSYPDGFALKVPVTGGPAD